MKTVISSLVGITFVVLATTSTFAASYVPQPAPAAHGGLTEG